MILNFRHVISCSDIPSKPLCLRVLVAYVPIFVSSWQLYDPVNARSSRGLVSTLTT